MNKGVEVLIKVVEGKTKSQIKCQEASALEISLAITHLEINKLKLVAMFNKLLKRQER